MALFPRIRWKRRHALGTMGTEGEHRSCGRRPAATGSSRPPSVQVEQTQGSFSTYSVEKEPRAVIASAQPSTRGANSTHTVEKATRAWGDGHRRGASKLRLRPAATGSSRPPSVQIEPTQGSFSTYSVEKEPSAGAGALKPSTRGANSTHTVEKAPRAGLTRRPTASPGRIGASPDASASTCGGRAPHAPHARWPSAASCAWTVQRTPTPASSPRWRPPASRRA